MVKKDRNKNILVEQAYFSHYQSTCKCSVLFFLPFLLQFLHFTIAISYITVNFLKMLFITCLLSLFIKMFISKAAY